MIEFIGEGKFAIAAFLYGWFIVECIENEKCEKFFNIGCSGIAISIGLFIVAILTGVISSIFNFQIGVDISAFIVLMTGFIFGVPFFMIWLFTHD